MTDSKTNPDSSRRGMLVVIMFGLLVASVGIAGWLSRTRGAPARRGAEVVEKIRALNDRR